MIFVREPSEQIKQGMIVDQIPWFFDGPKPLGIVLSNPCDLEHDKASYLLVAALIPAKETLQLTKEFQNKIQGVGEDYLLKGNKQWKGLTELIENFIHNKNIVRYYFIDPRPIIKAPLFFVDFQLILSIPISESAVLDKVAQLSSPFVEQMIIHFASYTSRIASERVDNSQAGEIITKIVEPYHTNI
jgi:hypothetical protein